MIIVDKIINSPILWLSATFFVYKLAEYTRKHRFFAKIPSTCFAAALLIALIKIFSVDYQNYNTGGSLITYLLGPATIALALPLIKNIDTLKQNWKVILIGVIVATVTGIMSVFFTAELFKATQPVVLSLIPKSVTTPIAVEISKSIGGMPELTSCFVIITGVLGGLLGHRFLKLINVKHHISIGLAMGAASHVLGTSRCIEKNELQAAISTISLIFVGLFTAILAPIIIKSII